MKHYRRKHNFENHKKLKASAAWLLAVLLFAAAPSQSASALEISNFSVSEASVSFSGLPGTVIMHDGNTTQEQLSEATNLYLKIPSGVRELFAENGAKIYLDGDVCLMESGSGRVVAYASCDAVTYDTSSLKIVSSSPAYIVFPSYYLEEYRYCLLHDAGHLFEHFSYSDEWTEIFNLCGSSIAALDTSTIEHSLSGREELFAETFMLVYTNPEGLYTVSPAAYEFVLRAVNKWCGFGTADTFDASDYCMRYPETAAALNCDAAAMYEYFISTGQYEGQTAKFL